MLSYITSFALTLFITYAITIVGIWMGQTIVHHGGKIVFALMERKLVIMGYRCFYANTNSVEKDIMCRQLLETLREVYNRNSNFNAYCTRISEERLPIYVFMNWTRSVAEDIFTANLPSAKIDQWNRYFKSSCYHRISLFYSDFPEYEDNEFGCLWGGVYFWLTVSFEKDMNDPIMNRVVYFGCKSKPSVPYFQHFFNQARNYCAHDYHLPEFSNHGEEMFERGMSSCNSSSDCISASEVYDGFEALSVSERCNARRVFNDVLPDSTGWSTIRNEMKKRGWFKETIYPYANVTENIYGDKVQGNKVEQKVVQDNRHIVQIGDSPQYDENKE